MSTSLFPTKELTPEEIISSLFSFHNNAHFYHLQTSSFAEHKALDNLYKELVEFKDEISEKLLGYTGRRFLSISYQSTPAYTVGVSTTLCTDIMNFSRRLGDLAQGKGWKDIYNISDSLHGLAAQTKYLLTLS